MWLTHFRRKSLAYSGLRRRQPTPARNSYALMTVQKAASVWRARERTVLAIQAARSRKGFIKRAEILSTIPAAGRSMLGDRVRADPES